MASTARAEAGMSRRQWAKPTASVTQCGSDWDAERRNWGQDEL
jgi:hypothetical protein